MEEIRIGTQNFTSVLRDGTTEKYYISRADIEDNELAGEFGSIFFQAGPIKETGVNGCHNEDLIAIVLDRLQRFQKGDMACRENAIAITKLEEAMHRLNDRTVARIASGVEGTHGRRNYGK